MRDGIYQVVYAGVSSAALGVFVVRNGAFSGVGQMGAEYHGSVRLEPPRNLYIFEGQATFPPNTPTVTGYVTSDGRMTLPIKGELSNPEPSTCFSLTFAGRSVAVAINYVCPIPG